MPALPWCGSAAKALKQRAKELGIALVFLPAYSPNLNLIERVWRMLKKHLSDNAASLGFDEYSAYADSYMDSTGGLRQAEISRLMSERFQMFAEAA